MNAAIYDSVNAINPTHTIYHTDARVAFPDASMASADAAAAQAAHDIAVRLYTNTDDVTAFNKLLDDQLGAITDGPAEEAGKALGAYVADQIWTWRLTDGSGATVPYVQRFEPGQWRPTPPSFALTPATPQWPFVTTFALKTGDQFRAGPPPALTSDAYTSAYEQGKSPGSFGPTARTAEQTQIALFWAGVGVTNAGVSIWNQITETVSVAPHLSLADNARLYAQMTVASADAFIAMFDTKYEYNFWRPVTAIRAADTDGNSATIQDPNWTPLIATPNHPSYGSNHSVHSRAAAEALAAFFGTDQVSFSATWGPWTRAFNKITDAT